MCSCRHTQSLARFVTPVLCTAGLLMCLQRTNCHRSICSQLAGKMVLRFSSDSSLYISDWPRRSLTVHVNYSLFVCLLFVVLLCFTPTYIQLRKCVCNGGQCALSRLLSGRIFISINRFISSFLQVWGRTRSFFCCSQSKAVVLYTKVAYTGLLISP